MSLLSPADDRRMFHVILHEPEIPPNTGNIMRLCANTGSRLHLIEPLGFELDDTRLRRAGLDYREYAAVEVHPSLQACLDQLLDTQKSAATTLDTQNPDPPPSLDTQELPTLDTQESPRVFAFSTRGHTRHDRIRWRAGDALLFGAETRGLPDSVLARFPAARQVRIPLRPDNRSLNLGNAVSVAVYEAWRQCGFAGAE